MRSLPTSPLALLAGLLLAATSGWADDRRAFGIEDYYRVANPTHLDLSPDGEHLVYQLKTTDLPRGEANTDLYRISTKGGEPQRLTWTEDASETSPAYSPDGKWISFVSSRGESEGAQLWLLPTSGGEARQLTNLSTGISEPVWSPDGRYIAFASTVHPECGADDACNVEKDTRREEGPVTAHVADELLYRHWASWSHGKVSHVLVVDVATGDVRDMTPGDVDAPVFSLGGPAGYAFSPDSRELCYTRNGDPQRAQAWSTNSDLWIVPVEPDADGNPQETRNVTAGNRAWDGSPLYSPDGRYLAYRYQTKAGYEADLFRLAVLERETGEVRTLTPEFDDWVGSFRWHADSSAIVFDAPGKGRNPLYRVATRGGEVEQLAAFATLDDFVLTDDAKSAYVVRRSIAQPRELWRLDLSGKSEDGTPQRLTRHNLALEEEVDIRPAETMWVEGADGKQVQVFVIKPHGFDPAKKYPLILNVHGGPQSYWADGFRGDWQMYPGAGYVLAFPNPSGSTGFGQDFVARISRDWGGAVFEDLMKVTDALAALPYVDEHRMGAMGWSYGGYMMNWFQGHTHRFRALANMMGLFDLRSFYYTTEELWFPEWDLGGAPWNSQLYEKWNPAASAAQFKTPMLIVSGELDFRVSYTQGLMAFTTLRRQGVPARLVVLPNAGHWPGWYEMALYYTAHLDWFHRYLGGDPAPWPVEDFANNAVFDSGTGERIDPGGDKAE
jgi:dipeptidyl aminopeptidase/acylaminoacyl peptidase